MPSRFRTILLLIAVLAAAVALPLSAQDWKGRGRVQGLVTNQDGQPVTGATVTVRREGKNDGPEATKTDEKGRWAVGGLATGNWEITIEAAGYNTAAGATKVIEGGFGAPETLRIELRPAQVTEQATQASASDSAISQGNKFLMEQKFSEARAEYEKALAATEKPETKGAILFGVAQAYAGEGKKKEAIKALEDSLVHKPGDEKVLRYLVRILVTEGREEEAQKYLAQLPQGATVDADTLLNMGIEKFNAKDLTGALERFDRVVKENPNLPDAYYYRALVYLNLEKVAEAKADFQKLLEIDPKHEKAEEVKGYLTELNKS